LVDLFLLRSSENCSLNLPDFQVLSQSAVAVYCGVLFSCVWVSGFCLLHNWFAFSHFDENAAFLNIKKEKKTAAIVSFRSLISS
jgi:hypothetical protein